MSVRADAPDKKADVKVGQVVYVQRRHGHSFGELKPESVTKVGREYFYVSPHHEQISLYEMTDKTGNGYGYSIRVWLSKEQYEEDKEVNQKRREIQEFFSSHRHLKNPENIRTVHAIIKQELSGG